MVIHNCKTNCRVNRSITADQLQYTCQSTALTAVLCAAGPFNCLQASLTSLAALAALRDLPKTNPALYLELTSLTAPPNEIENGDLFSKDEEDLTYNDESDVPA
ncbi:hypothetical protein B0H10DRAFT_1946954 [Mycena sp. CBHHK59/15]|nr:hypothetical protein B0H10DRAFT_1946954 [Mycena sp. CBHHK59/15]